LNFRTMDRIAASLAVLFSLVPLAAQPKNELPVGLVTESQGAELLRAGTRLPVGAKPGDILFTGDSLRSGASSSPVFLFCPTFSSERLQASTEVTFDAAEVRIKSGGIAHRSPAPICILPVSERAGGAAIQHYGASLRVAEPALNANRVKPDLAELAGPDRAIVADPRDLAAHVARAAILEKHDLLDDAMDEYRAILAIWPDAVWIASRLFQDGERSRGVNVAPDRLSRPKGKTYALVVGISTYQNARVPQLRYAHADAELFASHLRSPRGGGLADDQITLLTNEKASMAAVRNAITTLVKLQAGATDTVLLFFAAHGYSLGPGGYVLTVDSDPENLEGTALSMSEVQALFEQKLNAVGRVILYVDVCHAGLIGSIRGGNKINDIVQDLVEENEMFGMLASRKDQTAREGPEFGGHGVFSLYLVQALNGEADSDHNGVIDATEVVEYVQRQVAHATQRKQFPREIGNASQATILADAAKPGLDLRNLIGPVEVASTAPPRGDDRGALEEPAAPGSPRSEDARRDFDAAVAEGRVLPGSARNAFAYLAELQRVLPRRDLITEENRLRVALENRGQQVLLKYLKGEQTPQSKNDFLEGAAFFAAARRLTPESLLLEAREDFCWGRAALFDKDYIQGSGWLERAARIDPSAAYPYNALGIAYLEQANFAYAKLAFQDAIQRAPYWAYARHNLALAYFQTGEYDEAVRTYQMAMRLAPNYAYLPYNLGLIYQRMNLRREADAAFRQSIAADPQLADPYNALGYLNAATGRRREAERRYREALSRNPELLSARQNLAALLSLEPARRSEAVALWGENLAKDPNFLPSLLSLARALERSGDTAGAAAAYRRAIAVEPRFVGARRALAELELKLGNPAEALIQMQCALDIQPGDPVILELLGDIQKALGHPAEAATQYRLALLSANGRDTRKRIEKKLK
jgi:tetratricopeptide (TPR) repeat protein